MARRRDDDPFDDIFRQLERLMDTMMGARADVNFGAGAADTHVDVHEYDDRIAVIADLHGVEKDDIDLQCTGRTLSIRADGPVTRYAERVPLPVAVDETSASATYNNGVLEVKIERADDSANIDVS